MSATAPIDPKSWSFWKARLARALVVGALALGATQVLPTLPQDQVVEVIAPEGSMKLLKLTYLEDLESSIDAGTPLAGATLQVPAPGAKARHTAHLKNGKYLLLVEALVTNSDGKTRTWHERRPITLEGELVTVSLRSPSAATAP